MKNPPRRRLLRFEHLEQRHMFNGEFDPGFGVNGFALAAHVETVSQVVELPDGKLLAAGVRNLREGVVYRFLADGRLDSAFGQSGILRLGFWLPTDQRLIAPLPDGGFVVVGYGAGGTGNPSYVSLARYLANGAIDRAFGDNGYVYELGALANIGFGSVEVLPDGKIVAIGNRKPVPPDYVRGAVAARFLANGALDMSFGNGGIAFAPPGIEMVSAVLQDDGRYIIAGNTSSGDFALMRFGSDGALDTGFGGASAPIVVTDIGGFDRLDAISRHPDGRLLAIGQTRATFYPPSNFAAAMYSADGILDTTFGQNGRLMVDLGDDEQALSAAVQPDGSLLIAGVQWKSNFTWALVRCTPQGQLDTSFGVQGVVGLAPPVSGFAEYVTVSATGRAIVTGQRRGAGVIAKLFLSPPAKIAFAQPQLRVEETDGQVAIEVTRTAVSTGAVSVNYTTREGTAKAGEDYLATSGRLQWNDGEMGSKTIVVPLLSDWMDEPDHSFTIQLDDVVGNAFASTESITVTINERYLPKSSVHLDARYLAGVEGDGYLRVQVSRDGEFLVPARVEIRTLAPLTDDGNPATMDHDYTPIDLWLEWKEGDPPSKTVDIPIGDDKEKENPEFFWLTLDGLEGHAEYGYRTAEVVIVDDELGLGAFPNMAKIPGDGFNSIRFSPDGALSQILWVGNYLMFRVRQPDGRFRQEVVIGDLYYEGKDYRDAEQAQLLYDQDGIPHVLAIDTYDRLVHFARLDNHWAFIDLVELPIESSLYNFSFMSAMGSDNSLHLLFQQESATQDSGILTYGTNRSGTWEYETAGTTAAPPRQFFKYASEPRYFSMAVDAFGHIHATYTPMFENPISEDGTRRPNSALAYLTNRTGDWTSEIVFQPADRSGDAGLGASVAVGPDGKVAIAHFYVERSETGTVETARLQYFTERPGGGFSVETVAASADGYLAQSGSQFTGYAPHLLFDSAGRPNIAFSDFAAAWIFSRPEEFAGQIRHAVKVGNSWQIQTVFRQELPEKNQIVYPTMAIHGTELAFAALTRRDSYDSFFHLQSSRVPLLIGVGGLLWHNREQPLDVNQDNTVAPLDALLIINDLNQNGARRLPAVDFNVGPPAYFDVSGDGYTAPQDALSIINWLNGFRSNGEGEVAGIGLSGGVVKNDSFNTASVTTECGITGNEFIEIVQDEILAKVLDQDQAFGLYAWLADRSGVASPFLVHERTSQETRLTDEVFAAATFAATNPPMVIAEVARPNIVRGSNGKPSRLAVLNSYGTVDDSPTPDAYSDREEEPAPGLSTSTVQ